MDRGCSGDRGWSGVRTKGAWYGGSIVGVLVYFVIEAAHANAYYLHAIIFFFIVGTWASSRVERLYGHDSRRIVIDEVVGQMISWGRVRVQFMMVWQRYSRKGSSEGGQTLAGVFVAAVGRSRTGLEQHRPDP